MVTGGISIASKYRSRHMRNTATCRAHENGLRVATLAMLVQMGHPKPSQAVRTQASDPWHTPGWHVAFSDRSSGSLRLP